MRWMNFRRPGAAPINRAKLPYWKMTLLNVCNLVNNMNNQVGETVEADEDVISGRQFPAGLDGFSLEAMLTVYQLQKVCHSRAFQHWELLQQDAYDLENSSQEKEIMKRKNPYILKRQLHVNKARRPYILKRSSGYLDGSERPSNQQMDWKKLCSTSLAGNLQLAKINDSFEVAIWGNSMGSIQEVLERAGAEGSTSGALGPRNSLLETPTKINLHKGPAPSSGFAEFSSSIGSMAGAVTSSKVRRGGSLSLMEVAEGKPDEGFTSFASSFSLDHYFVGLGTEVEGIIQVKLEECRTIITNIDMQKEKSLLHPTHLLPNFYNRTEQFFNLGTPPTGTPTAAAVGH
ncbi:Large neuromedin N [Aix galericulata]|nr:Large neuromedin N [Aix galericulata]